MTSVRDKLTKEETMERRIYFTAIIGTEKKTYRAVGRENLIDMIKLLKDFYGAALTIKDIRRQGRS
jgi:hypothetical protein